MYLNKQKEHIEMRLKSTVAREISNIPEPICVLKSHIASLEMVRMSGGSFVMPLAFIAFSLIIITQLVLMWIRNHFIGIPL